MRLIESGGWLHRKKEREREREREREGSDSRPLIVLAVQRPYSARRQPWGALGDSLKKNAGTIYRGERRFSLSLFLAREMKSSRVGR